LLVRCYLTQGKFAEASELAAKLLVKSSYFALVLPITQLVAGLLTHHNEPLAISPTRGLISVAIIFDIYSRYVSSDRGAERADAYKDVLRRHEVDRASRLNATSNDELIYFLRHVCVPDVLDQSLALLGTRDVEDERIAILRRLIEMMTSPGKLPPPEIKEELREITTRQVVRDTSLRLDQSKIYVNVDGIRRNIDVIMREDWNRYKLIASASVDFTFQEQLERILEGKMVTRVTVVSYAPFVQARALLTRMIGQLRDEFTSNKEFGLNSNLSTNIRHGYVLLEFRSPLVNRKLITNRNSENEDYVDNTYWLDPLSDSDSSGRLRLRGILNSFSARVDEEINFVNKLLQIRADKTPQGLFIYEGVERVIAPIGAAISKAETYDEFVAEVFASLWKVTEKNLSQVRDKLMMVVLPTFGDALGRLEGELREGGFDQLVPALLTAIPLARLDMQVAIERVASWFTLSSNSEYQDFDLEIAYRAALSSVKTYYSNISIHSAYVSHPGPIMLQGWCLPILARLFFLILDNAAFHGASEVMRLRISTSVALGGNDLLSLKISNTLPGGLDLNRLRSTINSINDAYGEEKAKEMVGQEGGSGYPKMWKLLNFDLGSRHSVRAAQEGSEFVVYVDIDATELVKR
jgi:hypothetical protein